MKGIKQHLVVTGGAGYLGAHVVIRLVEKGFRVTVVDDLSSGHPPFTELAENFVRLDIRDRSALTALLYRLRPLAVVHLAGRHDNRRSFLDPEVYAEINLGGTASLLSAMRRTGVMRLIFRSDMEVFGLGSGAPISESHPLSPTSPLGRLLATTEALLDDARKAWGLSAVCLRFAHLAGADQKKRAGDTRSLMRSPVTSGLCLDNRHQARPPEPTQAETKTSSSQLDLLHVSDAASAVSAVLDAWLDERTLQPSYHIGSGRVCSRRQILAALESVLGHVPAERPSDRTALHNCLAHIGLAREQLGWEPACSDLNQIVESAFDFLSAGSERREAVDDT